MFIVLVFYAHNYRSNIIQNILTLAIRSTENNAYLNIFNQARFVVIIRYQK
jgi:hypothetical protein